MTYGSRPNGDNSGFVFHSISGTILLSQYWGFPWFPQHNDVHVTVLS